MLQLVVTQPTRPGQFQRWFVLVMSRQAKAYRTLIQRSWSSIHSPHTDLIDHSYPQILFNSNLAGEAHVGRKLLFHCEPISFEFTHFTGITFQNLHSTSRATRITTAPMQDVYTRVFDNKHQLLLCWCFSFNHSIGSLCHDLRH